MSLLYDVTKVIVTSQDKVCCLQFPDIEEFEKLVQFLRKLMYVDCEQIGNC